MSVSLISDILHIFPAYHIKYELYIERVKIDFSKLLFFWQRRVEFDWQTSLEIMHTIWCGKYSHDHKEWIKAPRLTRAKNWTHNLNEIWWISFGVETHWFLFSFLLFKFYVTLAERSLPRAKTKNRRNQMEPTWNHQYEANNIWIDTKFFESQKEKWQKRWR